MARQTRSQRRERRAQTAGAVDGSRARSAAPQPRAAEESRREAGGHLPGAGGKRFVSESIAELKKVEWPTQQQLIQGVTVVLIACAIVGAYLWLSDLAFHRLVQRVFLRQ